MKRYSDDWRCPKCGHAGQPKWYGANAVDSGGVVQSFGGPLMVICVTCEYSEQVLPLDSPKSPREYDGSRLPAEVNK